MNDYIVSIDVGSSKVSAAMGTMDKQGKLQVLGVTSVKCHGLKKSIVVDIDATSEAIKKCKENLETITDLPINEVYLCFSGGLCELINSKGIVAITSKNREVSMHDVERVLSAAKIISLPSGKEIIGIISEFYTIDEYDKIIDPVGMTGRRLEVDAKAVVSSSKIITNLKKSVELAGLYVSGIIIHPLAQAALVSSQDHINTNVCFVDIGADTMDISIYKGGTICYMKLIPLGGSSITIDISKCLKISMNDAEKLKLMYGDVKNNEEYENEDIIVNSSYDDSLTIQRSLIVEIIKARAEELLKFLLEDIKVSGYYEDISVIYFSGGGLSLLQNIVDLSKEILNKSVKIILLPHVGASNPIYNNATGAIKSVYDSLRSLDELSENEHNNFSILNKNYKFVSKIKKLLENIF